MPEQALRVGVRAPAARDRAALVALVALERARPARRRAEIATEVLACGAEEVWARQAPQLTLAALAGDGTVGDGTAGEGTAGEGTANDGLGPDPLASAARDLERWAARGLRVVTIGDDEYPARLRAVHEAPLILFVRGALTRDDRAVCVVGTRRPTDRGLRTAAGVATALVEEGVSVVAGLAAGIDAAAHTAALAAGGRTVAVLGTGITRVYPARNVGLAGEIARSGLLLSQFWPDDAGDRATFPARNATMSGYGLATVVVEAGETSGARVQARVALAHGRPVILMDAVVEGSRWGRELSGRPGVQVAAGAQEVLRLVESIERDQQDVTETLRRWRSAR